MWNAEKSDTLLRGMGVVVVFLVYMAMVPSAWALDVDSEVDAVRKVYAGKVDKVVKKRIWLTDTDRSKISKIAKKSVTDRSIVYYIGMKNGQPVGYATLETVINRVWPISYIIVINPDGTVQNVEVLNYQGARTWSVQSKNWLHQFLGKNAESDFSAPLQVTGATISVRTVNQGVLKAVAAYKVLFLDKAK